MTEILECVYEIGVIKPIGKVVELKKGEGVKVMIDKKIDFEPIKLKKLRKSGLNYGPLF